MRQIMQFVLSGLGIAFSTRWRDLMTRTETPSLRYVRKLNRQRSQFISGQEGLKEKKSMGRILDPDWSQFQYVPAAKTDLKESMERYKRMVSGENQELHTVEKDGDTTRNNGQVHGEQNDSGQRHKLVAIRRKG
jgi:hypothetical protein